MSGEVPPFYPQGDDVADHGESYRQQGIDLAADSAATEMLGGQSYFEPPGTTMAGTSDPAAFIAEKISQKHMLDARVAEVDAGIDTDRINAYRDQIIERYKAHNSGLVTEDPTLRAWQSRPIQVDPNEHAEIENMIAQWHQARVAAGFEQGVYNDPKLARTLKVLQADMGLGKPGYFTRGEQQYDPGYGPLGFVATEVVNPVVSHIWDAGMNLGYGLMHMGATALEGLTGETYVHTLPTHSMIDDEGRVHSNAGKLPTFNEMATSVMGQVFDWEVEEKINSLGLSEEYARARRSGMTEVTHSVSSTLGMFAGFAAPGGPAMAVGNNLAKAGIGTMVGAERIAAMAPWAKQMLNYSSKSGAIVGNSLLMGSMYGHHMGYATAFEEGAAMTIPILALGALGNKAEAVIRSFSRSKMPEAATRMLAGAIEGAGFAGYEIAASPELWEFVRDPNDQTHANWQTILRNNVLAMAIMKGATGGTPGQQALDRMQGFGQEVQRARQVEQGRDVAAVREVQRAPEPEPAPEVAGPPAVVAEGRGASRGASELRGAETAESLRAAAERRESPVQRIARQERQKREQDVEDWFARNMENALQNAVTKPQGPWTHEKSMQLFKFLDRVAEKAQEPAVVAERKRFMEDFQRRHEEGLKQWEGGERRMEERRGEDAGPPEGQQERRGTPQRRRAADRLRQLRQEVRDLQTDPETQLSTPQMFRRAQDRIDADPGKEWVQVDVRGLKELNDLISMEAGDLQIRRTAGAVRVMAREMGISPREIFRAGGDEFGVAVPKGRGAEFGRAVAEMVGLQEVAGTKMQTGARFGVGDTWRGASEAVGQAKAAEKGPTLRGQKRGEPEDVLAERRDLPTVEEGDDPTRKGVSRGTMGALGRAILSGDKAATERARSQARIEAEGHAQDPMAARELLYERVSSREAFPAEGREGRAEGREGVEPIHARDVIAEADVGPISPVVLSGMMGVRKRWARGYYSTREDLVMMEGARDLNNLAHEWGHALWEKLGRRMGLSGTAERQLIEVGQPTSTPRMRADAKMHEGMAEFMARHLLGDRDLGRRYPELYSEVMDFLSRPEQAGVSEQLGRLERAYERWRDQGMLNQLRMSWIAADEPLTTQQAQLTLGKPVEKVTPLTKLRVGFRKAVTAFEHAMVDDLAKVKRAQADAFKRAGVSPDRVPITSNPGRMLDVVRGKSGAVMETFLFRNTIGFGGTSRKGKSLRDVLKDIKPEEREAFVDYLIARRSLEAQGKGMSTQLSREHYLLGVDRYGNERFETAARDLKQWFDHVIDYAVEGGSLTNEAATAIKDSWSVYVPFFRALSGPKQVQPGRGVAERASGVGRMKGSEVEIRDPLEAALEVAQSIIQKAHQAAAMKAFYNLHLTTEGVGRFVTEVPRKVEPKKVTFEELAEALEKQNFPGDIQHISETFADALRHLSADDASAIITMFTQASRPSGAEPVVAFVPRYTEAELAQFASRRATKRGFANLADQVRAESGKVKWLRLHNDAYEAVMDIDPMTHLQHPILRALTLPTTWVKFGATAVNPAFMVRNVARDAVLNQLFSDVRTASRFVPVIGAGANFVAGLTLQFKGSESANLFRDIGGMQATFFGREFGLASRQVHNPSTPAEAYRKLLAGLATPEATLRIREFDGIRRKALEEGKSELEANLEALEAGQEVSVNFIRGGAMARALNQWIPYFNPGIQGNRKFLRATLGFDGRKKQMQAIAQGLSNITLPSLALWLMFRDEDWYRDLPEWRKMNYWTMPVPFTNELVSVPKPFEAGKIFGNIPEWVLNQAAGEPIELSAVGMDVLANFFNGFDFVPALLGPALENVTNFSMFRQREMVPHWMQEGRLPEDQYTSYTTSVAKFFGDILNVSPIKVENFAGGYSGGLLLRAMRAFDLVTGGTPNAADPGVDMEDVPFIGTLFTQRRHKHGGYVQQVYDLHREMNQLAGSDALSPEQTAMRPMVRNAKEEISRIKKMAREGQLTADEANKRTFEIARPIIEAYRKATQ